MATLRRQRGSKAKDILIHYGTELPKQFQQILDDIKGELTQRGIINRGSIDLNTPGMSDQRTASKLYDNILSCLESNPDKFVALVDTFKLYNSLTSIAEELEEEGT